MFGNQKIKKSKHINRKSFVFYLLLPLIFSGCYEEKVEKAVSKLKPGMERSEQQKICKGLTFLKTQTVSVPSKLTEEEARDRLYPYGQNEKVYPENLFEGIPLNGTIKVDSYLIRRHQPFANPLDLQYLAIFYNNITNQIIGWGNYSSGREVKDWDEQFYN